MSCETSEGKILSTFSGRWVNLIDWVEGPDCSDGPDRRCEHLGNIQSYAQEQVEIECIEDVGNKKYTLACKHTFDGTILSTVTDKYKKLRQWAAGPLCKTEVQCPRLEEIQQATTNGAAKIKCIEDKGKKYKIGCYIWDDLLSTKTGTVEKLKEWVAGEKCSQYRCHCGDQFYFKDQSYCVWPNRWQCNSHWYQDENGSWTSDTITFNVKKNKKKYCEKMVKNSGCDLDWWSSLAELQDNGAFAKQQNQTTQNLWQKLSD